jgi:hypothetical protein
MAGTLRVEEGDMCRCKTLRQRVEFLEAALGEAEWDLRYQAVINGHDRDTPDRRIQLVVASDLARARLGLPSVRRAVETARALAVE